MLDDKEILNAKILIVDDEPINVLLLEEMLHIAGFKNTRSTEDPRETLQLYREFHPDVLALDITMPHMDGFQVMEQLSEETKNHYFPIIILTALDDRKTRLKALSLGAKDFLTKPLNKTEVVTRIKNLVEVRLLINIINEQNHLLEARVSDRTKELEKEISERKKVEEENYYYVTHDRLTGLPNDVWLFNYLQELVEKEETKHAPFALLLLSLEHFNAINKTLGHSRGDVILQLVAIRLSENIRKLELADIPEEESRRDDQVTRYSGGKFAIVLRNISGEEEVISIAQRILSLLDQPFDVPNLSLDISARVGIAMYPNQGQDPDTVIRRSEVALHFAKTTNKRVLAYSEDIDFYSERKLSMMVELRQALADNSLSLYYQPKIDIRDNSFAGVEALLRWIHPSLGFIPPLEFIELAEQSSVIKPLTKWVLDAAAKQVQQFIQHHIHITTSINISPMCLKDTDLIHWVEECVDNYTIPADSLIFEITEGAMMENPKFALQILTELNDLGVKISIDDYGTGYSSLAYLKQLPVSELKIDRAFIRELVNDDDDKVIVSTTIELGRNFGLNVVAEGVEDKETVDILKSYNCHMVQGYYFAKPMPVDDLYEWINQHQKKVVGE